MRGPGGLPRHQGFADPENASFNARYSVPPSRKGQQPTGSLQRAPGYGGYAPFGASAGATREGPGNARPTIAGGGGAGNTYVSPYGEASSGMLNSGLHNSMDAGSIRGDVGAPPFNAPSQRRGLGSGDGSDVAGAAFGALGSSTALHAAGSGSGFSRTSLPTVGRSSFSGMGLRGPGPCRTATTSSTATNPPSLDNSRGPLHTSFYSAHSAGFQPAAANSAFESVARNRHPQPHNLHAGGVAGYAHNSQGKLKEQHRASATAASRASFTMPSLKRRTLTAVLSASLIFIRLFASPFLIGLGENDAIDWYDPLHFLSWSAAAEVSGLLGLPYWAPPPRAGSLLTWRPAGYQRTFLLPWVGVVWGWRFLGTKFAVLRQAMHSFLSLLVQSDVAAASQMLLTVSQFEFFAVKMTLAGLFAYSELRLSRSIERFMGASVRTFFILLCIVSGLSLNAAAQLAPSSVAGVALCLTLAAFFEGRYRSAAVILAASSILISPVVLIAAAPVALSCLSRVSVIGYALGAAGATLGLQYAAEFALYRRLVHSPLHSVQEALGPSWNSVSALSAKRFAMENLKTLLTSQKSVLSGFAVLAFALLGSFCVLLVSLFLIKPKTAPQNPHCPPTRPALLAVLLGVVFHITALGLFNGPSQWILRPINGPLHVLAAYGLSYFFTGRSSEAAVKKSDLPTDGAAGGGNGFRAQSGVDMLDFGLSPDVRRPVYHRPIPFKRRFFAHFCKWHFFSALLLPLILTAQLFSTTLYTWIEWKGYWNPTFSLWNEAAHASRADLAKTGSIFCSGNSWDRYASAFFLPDGAEFHIVHDAHETATLSPLQLTSSGAAPQGSSVRTRSLFECNFLVDIARAGAVELPQMSLLRANGVSLSHFIDDRTHVLTMPGGLTRRLQLDQCRKVQTPAETNLAPLAIAPSTNPRERAQLVIRNLLSQPENLLGARRHEMLLCLWKLSGL